MLKLELQESAAVALVFTAVAFTARRGLTPLHSHISLTPWSVFQDGSCGRASFDNIQQAGVPQPYVQRRFRALELMSNREDLTSTLLFR